MAIRVALKHSTEYFYDRPVSLSPHQIRLRPAPHSRTPVHQYALDIEPKPHFLNWQQDPFGNHIARLVFPEKTKKFSVNVSLIADLVTINPFDFFTEDYASDFGFDYEPQLKEELTPYFEVKEAGPRLKALLGDICREPKPIVDFLVEVNALLEQRIDYTVRMEPGVQTCEETLEKASGSCRDSAWLQVQLLRHLGLAARFVSGYLVQLTADEKSLDGPSGPEADFTDLHAWTEVFVPGAGWVGMDPTSGLFAGEGHIPLACTPDPVSAAPIVGGTDKCEVTFGFANEVTRIHEDPRVTKPYTESQWQAILEEGDAVDKRLSQGDVRLTMGGEPTFVSIDDMDSAQWNTEALGGHKLERAGVLLRRLKDAFSQGAVLQYGQGKWYPGEQLPRWAMHCFWRADGEPVWTHPELLADPATEDARTVEDARRLLQQLCQELDIDPDDASTGYEDVAYYLWKEGTLPGNVNVIDNRLKDPIERERLRRVFEQGLDKVVGFALPLAWDYSLNKDTGGGWVSSPWTFRREHMFLLPGDSPMGYRLPLDSLIWEPKGKQHNVHALDPHAPRTALPANRDRWRLAVRPPVTSDSPEQFERPPAADQRPSSTDKAYELIRTALCIEPRGGHLNVFLPPMRELEHYLDLISALEAASVACNLPIVIEGYEPPKDHRLKHFSVTPDPGVIEVNIHPATGWRELVDNTQTLYQEARLSRLGTEKFMLDGRHTGTGGGNHVTIGGLTPSDSPVLRRPDLLKSLITYWQQHPSLSYLFSGMFIGPTSQAPRVDEARDDALYELAIAFSEIPDRETTSPWLVDRILRHLLVDVTGNTHRAEFCIDKLYSPDSATGRLGLVEFRGFEMPPHARMSMVQQLLLRSLIVRFWETPFEGKPVRWGTELHDRFMLPHFVESDIRDVVGDLNRSGIRFDAAWFDPFVEFRFPRYGTFNIDDIEVELRFAIEPWDVLGEEVGSFGTARYVDSSVERLQIKVTGMLSERHAVLCNGRRLPLRSTGTRGEFVAGLRYKAWQPPSALHPTIPAQAPLTFDIVDTWNQRSIGGCTYHVEHPGGRNPDDFPVNANAAESRRLARFQQLGHTPGNIEIPDEELNPDFPYTLDLRTPPSHFGKVVR